MSHREGGDATTTGDATEATTADDSSDAAASAGAHSDDGVPDAPRPPHVDGLPLVGSTVAFVRDGLAFGDRVLERGDVVSYDAFGEQFVAVADPDAVESILVSRNDAFRKGEFETEFGSLIAPEGLAFTEGEQWERQRMALQGSFTPATVQGFAAAIVDRATALADDWAARETVHLREDAKTFALDVLARTLLDVDLDGERGAVVSAAADAIAAYASPASVAAPDWLPTPAGRRYERAVADLDALVADLVAERRRGATDGDYGDDLLGAMLAAVDATGDDADGAGGIRERELRDQLVTFLFAGHETTATALSYVVWLLADHPGVRERLDAELDAVLDGRTPTFADLPRLAYTEAVVEEALRLYPPVTAIYREPREPTTVGGYRVDPGQALQLATYHVQRDPRWWEDPTAFRPERWLDAADAPATLDDAAEGGGPLAFGRDDRPEYAFFPFGGGPRHCIGMRFARMELRLALATLAARLEFDRLGGFDPSVRVTLDPGDVRIRATERA